VVYDRIQLIDRVIATVRQNLLEGAFLVVVILYVMLGNLRAGLVAATAIPLSMMCGFIGMWQAGIAASLLSLGAIDFGIVVDHIGRGHREHPRKDRPSPGSDGSRAAEARAGGHQRGREARLLRAAAIMTVYIPILTLEGVEEDVSPDGTHGRVHPDRLARALAHSRARALEHSAAPDGHDDVLLAEGLAGRRSAAAPGLPRGPRHARPGGRRDPRHHGPAGGVARHGVRAEALRRRHRARHHPGSRHASRIASDEHADREGPARGVSGEIAHVWSRTGTPRWPPTREPSRPPTCSSPQARSSWKRARTQAGLVEVMNKVVEDIPGQIIRFTEPIEQRINEMVSGVRADIAVKVFGSELDCARDQG